MKIFFILLISLISYSSTAQYHLKFNIDGLKDTTIFLARYLGDRLYYADTTESINGKVEFKKDNYKGGVYALICPGPNYFEFIMSDQQIEMETSINSFIPDMKVKKSEENKVFYNYIQFINEKKNQAEVFKAAGNNDELAKLDKEVKDFQKKIVIENGSKLIGKILNMSIDPVIPEAFQKNDTLKYQFYLEHFGTT